MMVLAFAGVAMVLVRIRSYIVSRIEMALNLMSKRFLALSTLSKLRRFGMILQSMSEDDKDAQALKAHLQSDVGAFSRQSSCT
ncbi:hypothetical protein M758_10G127400 [Ceratodon purpureus]|uniref:Uncharacterized protein n=1 Tax=Ceratodon purpureus TaxID=3225 RepID=A0A8T0GMN7_CERPU|nr:hypothetical protein KC19_10G132700 [Ceratodon purpureus]KAG0603879.1 hypothetical protein M758_10G127400 [Ceratodon purpureus]